tara:strand:- start:11483 stop:12217 length:735 start_codon:yes stop_codon:yes gene_type:complete
VSKLPRLTQGIGSLTPEAWEVIANMAEFGSANAQRLNELAKPVTRFNDPIDMFLARITGNKRQALSDPNDQNAKVRRWLYSWVKAEVDPSDDTGATFRDPVFESAEATAMSSSVTDPDTGETDAFSNYALNMCELHNTRTLTGPGYQYSKVMPIGECEATGFNKQAEDASGTTETIFVSVVVPMFVVHDNERKPRFMFYCHNAHANACMDRDDPAFLHGSNSSQGIYNAGGGYGNCGNASDIYP